MDFIIDRSAAPVKRTEWMDDVRQELESRAGGVAGVDRVIVGVGPGSFTGIRASIAALGGMALVLGKPLLGFASAAAVAVASGEQGSVTVVGDARRGKYWIARYRVEGDVVTRADGRPLSNREDDFELIDPQDLPRVARDATLVSAEWTRLEPAMRGAGARRLVDREVLPTPEACARFVAANGDTLVAEPLPIYLQSAVQEHPEK